MTPPYMFMLTFQVRPTTVLNKTRPPRGIVNVERSLEICQSVVRNSPNRSQVESKLKQPVVAATAASVASLQKPVAVATTTMAAQMIRGLKPVAAATVKVQLPTTPVQVIRPQQQQHQGVRVTVPPRASSAPTPGTCDLIASA